VDRIIILGDDLNEDDLNDYTDFRYNNIEMTKESAQLIKLIRENLCKIFERDVSMAETINMLVAMGIEEWNTMQNEQEAKDLI